MSFDREPLLPSVDGGLENPPIPPPQPVREAIPTLPPIIEPPTPSSATVLPVPVVATETLPIQVTQESDSLSPAPPALPPPLPPDQAALAVTPPARRPLPPLPWKQIGEITGGLLGLIGLGFGLWWLGIGFGAPANTSKAFGLALQTLQKAGSYHVEGTMTLLTATTPPDQPTDLSLLGKSPSTLMRLNLDFAGDHAATSASEWSLQIDLNDIPTTVLPESLPKNVTMELRDADRTLYLKAPIFSTLFGFEASQWLGIDRSTAAPLTDSFSQLTQRGKGRRLGFERLGAVSTAHYQLVLTADELTQWLADTNQTWSAYVPSDAPMTLDFWLGVSDRRPYKAIVKLGNDGIGQTQITLTANLSHLGQTVVIQKPSESETVRQSMSDLNLTNLSSSFQLQARDSQRKADLARLQTALAQYKQDYGVYLATNNQTTRTNQIKGVLQVLIEKAYLTALPLDPLDPTYWYGYKSDGTTYEVWSILEKRDDPAGIPRDNYILYVRTPTTVTTPTSAPSVSPSPSTSATPSTLPVI